MLCTCRVRPMIQIQNQKGLLQRSCSRATCCGPHFTKGELRLETLVHETNLQQEVLRHPSLGLASNLVLRAAVQFAGALIQDSLHHR